MTVHHLVLQVDKVSIGYTKPLFEDLTFSLLEGEVLAILGRNGIGKSTLLDAIVGLAKPMKGGIDADLPLGYVPQQFVQDLSFDVLNVVLLGRASRIGVFRQPTREDETQAQMLLKRLSIEHLASRPFYTLSGGQKQMVMFARALATGSSVLVLDEPMAALDLEAQQRVLRLIYSLAKEEKKAVIFSTHDPLHAFKVASHALLLEEQGRWHVGETKDVLTSERLTEAYGLPVNLIIDPIGDMMPVPLMTVA